MTEITADWPRKTREMHSHHFDSTVWNDFRFRDDDIVVSTYAKSGTTWTQQIISQLVFKGDEAPIVADHSPWLDLRVPPTEVKLGMLEAQTHRRVVKTHLPVDALVMSPKAKYVYVGRDGRDVLFSLYNHHANASPLWYELLNDTPGLVGPPIPRADPDIRRYFDTWLEDDGAPFWSFWENVNSWWALRGLRQVRLVHFANLKADLEGQMRALAEFLEIDIPQSAWPRIVEHCTFDYMKAHADKVAPLGGAIFEGGGATFINKGVNGRWRDVLSPAQIAAYETKVAEKLDPACAHWLATGEEA